MNTTDDPHQPDEATELFARFLAEGRDDDAAFEAFCAGYPRAAHALRELYRAWRHAEAVIADAPTSIANGGEASLDDRECAVGPDQIRYEPIAEIGRGGMGMVRKVFDHRLGRPIAMKTILVEAGGGGAATRGARERFVAEAKVMARLDHPSIVPVHEVGTDAEGRLYFTMKVVEGRTLREVIDARASGDERWSLERAVGAVVLVCEAVAYAHDRGVLHRDLKPSNVMVGEYGETYVMDWGLARLEGPHQGEERPDEPDDRSPGDSDLTRTGDLLGTAAYMAPEIARGGAGRATQASDVYAVGAMLYHLLGGRMPYHVGEATPDAILSRVTEGPPPPLSEIAVRTSPGELVSICDRAMAREPEARYPSMIALAEDLRAYLEGRVVRAHESGTWAELRKWTRRNRALALTMALGLPLVTAATIFTTQQVAQNARRERQKQAELEEELLADAFVRLADRRFDVAKGPFEELMRRMPGRPEPVVGLALTALRQGNPEEAVLVLERHDTLLEKHPSVNRLLATALQRVNRLEDAAVAAARVPRSSDSPRDLFLHAVSEMDAGHEGDDAAFERAAALLEEAVEREPDRILYHVEWAHALGHSPDPQRALVAVAVMEARWPTSRAAQYQAGRALMSAGENERAVPFYRRILAMNPDDLSARIGLGMALLHSGSVSEAGDELDRALSLDPDNIVALGNLSDVDMRMNRHDDAITRLRRILESHPDHLDTLWLLARALNETGRFEEALPLARRATDLDPRSAEARFQLARALARTEQNHEAVRAYEVVLDARPDDAEAQTNLGIEYLEQGRRAEALTAFERAIAIKSTLWNPRYWIGAVVEPDAPDVAARRWAQSVPVFVSSWGPGYEFVARKIAATLSAHGYRSAAREVLEAALAWDSPDVEAWYRLANAQQASGLWSESVTSYRKAAELSPTTPEIWCNLRNSYKMLGRFDEALAAIEKGHELGRRLETWSYPSAVWVEDARKQLALHRAMAGAIERGEDLSPLAPAEERAECAARSGWYDVAVDAYAEALAGEEEDDARGILLYNAAGSAAMASTLERFPEARRAAWRDRALSWLEGSLARLERAVESGGDVIEVRGDVDMIGTDPTLAPLFDAASIDRFPPPTKDRCQDALLRLWLVGERVGLPRG